MSGADLFGSAGIYSVTKTPYVIATLRFVVSEELN